MKTILFITIASLCAAQIPIEEAKDMLPPSQTITSNDVKRFTIKSANNLTVVENPQPVFMLRGLPQLQARADNGGFFSMMPTFTRPEKPEEVVVELWTKDGRKWAAKWEEVKTK